jgi:hypothetical protein
MSLNSCGCPIIPIDKNGGHTIESPQISRPMGSIGESNSSDLVGHPLNSLSDGVKGKKQQNVVFVPGTAVDLSRDGRWPEPT